MTQTDNALIVVDYEKSFIPVEEWGTWELRVEWGWLLAPRINELMKETKTAWWLIIASRDLHPQWHMSFASNYIWKNSFETVGWDEVVNSIPARVELQDTAGFNLKDLQAEFWAKWSQMLWPDHCVEWTQWSEYHDELDLSMIDHHIIKWYDPTTEMYSGFFWKEDTPEWKKLTDILRDAWVKTVKLVWLATDYCVQSTAVDAVKNGFQAIIDSSAVRWVAVSPGEAIAYLETLREKEWVDYK